MVKTSIRAGHPCALARKGFGMKEVGVCGYDGGVRTCRVTKTTRSQLTHTAKNLQEDVLSEIERHINFTRTSFTGGHVIAERRVILHECCAGDFSSITGQAGGDCVLTRNVEIGAHTRGSQWRGFECRVGRWAVKRGGIGEDGRGGHRV